MGKKNDDRIRALMQKVKTLKKEVGTKPRQVLETNGALRDADGKVVNLNTVQDVDRLVDALSFLRVAKKSREDAAKVLEIDGYEFKQDGYTYGQWEADIKMRAAEIVRLAKKKQLETLEKKLKNLVSEEEKTAMELDDIESLLA